MILYEQTEVLQQQMVILARMVIEFYTYFLLADTFFSSRRTGAARSWMTLVFFVADYFLVQNCPHVLVKAAAEILLFSLLTGLLYQAKAIPCIFTGIQWAAILNLSDVIILYGLLIFTEQSLADLRSSYRIASEAILFSLAKILGLVIVSLIHVWGTTYFKHKAQHIGNYLRFGIYPLVTLISAFLMYYAAVTAPQAAPVLLICVILLLATDILSIFMMRRFELQQEELSNAYILRRQLDSAMDNITAATQSYENERKLTHDFQNQLIVIRGMLGGTADRSEIITYLDQIAHYTSSFSLPVSTNRTAADVLLNQKYIIAKQKEIDFQIRLDDLSAFPLPDNALVVLLSNLLDNAIEACYKIANCEERWILVKMSVGQEDCLLCVENAVPGPVLIEDNQIKTTKSDPNRHGYGMKNIAAIVSTYDGYYTMRCDEKVFQFAAVFPGAQTERL